MGDVWDHVRGDSRAFLLPGADDHGLTNISVPGASQTEVFGIDNMGTTWGTYKFPAPGPSGFSLGSFVRTGSGTVTLTPGALTGPRPMTSTFEVPGAYPGTTAVYGMNAEGQLVGQFGMLIDPGRSVPPYLVEYGFLATPTPTPLLSPAAIAPEPTTWMPAALGGLALLTGLLSRSRRA